MPGTQLLGEPPPPLLLPLGSLPPAEFEAVAPGFEPPASLDVLVAVVDFTPLLPARVLPELELDPPLPEFELLALLVVVELLLLLDELFLPELELPPPTLELLPDCPPTLSLLESLG